MDELRALQKGPHEFLLQVAERYGPVVRYPVGPLAIYLVTSPDAVKHVLQDNHRNYSKDTFQYNLLGTVTGQGLLTSDGDLWLRQRRLAQPAFHKTRIDASGSLMAGAAGAMLDRWSGYAARGEPLDVAAEMMHVALQIVGKAHFSVEIGDQADDLARATLDVLDHIVSRARSFGLVPEWLPTAGNRRFAAAMKTLDLRVNATIRQRRSDGSRPDDLLQMLLSARDEATGEGMTDRQLRDESMTTLIAGHETVASALAWTWHLLSGHSDAESHLHAKVDAVLGRRPPTAADLPNLKYAKLVFQEALRLYPPAWIISRKALADDELGGYMIPAGALVVTSPYVTHRLAGYWPDPEAFCPERFLPEASASRHRFAYFPFGGGPRQCIGNTFAMAEAGLIIASVAQRYALRTFPGHPVEVEAGVTLRPKHGLLMSVNPRP